MRAWGKEIVAGMNVCLKANVKIKGHIIRIYPFDDKPNIMVKWDSGSIKTVDISDIKV